MIDIKLFREHPDRVKESQRKRGKSEKEIDEFLVLDKKWRELKSKSDSLRADRNKVSQEINTLKKQGKNVNALLKKAREIPEKLFVLEAQMKSIEDKRFVLLKNIPNILDASVPIGDASKNKVIEVVGKAEKKKLRGHEDILIELDCLDIERAAKVSGARFYYLKNDLVLLNQALINFALGFLAKKGFTLIQPPFMLRKAALEGAITLTAFEEMIYKIENEDLYLIGTAEHAINSYYMNETLDSKHLPIRFAGVSSCFRKEAGSHGKDTKGIFRIHQFEKVEQFIFCKPSDSEKEFEFMLNNSKELFKQLDIPFRVVLLASQETGLVASKTIDLEGWFPSQGEYRELGSCSNVLDYQSRRSIIKFQDRGELRFVHTLNNTAIATERMIVCIVENFQQKDSSVTIPKVLVPYMHRKKIIQKELPIKTKS